MNQIGLNNRYPNIKPSFKAEGSAAAELPEMYDYDTYEPKTFRESLKQADVMNITTPWIEHPILSAATFGGIAYGMDKFINACGGEYEKSLLGKTAKLGDNIQNSKFVQSKPFQSVLEYSRKGGNKIAHFFRNSDVINAIRKTPSMPEWGFVKDELLTQDQRIAHEFIRIVDTACNGDNGLLSIFNIGNKSYLEPGALGFSEAEKEMVKGLSEEASSITVILKRLGRGDSDIQRVLNAENKSDALRSEILKEVGFTEEMWEKIKKDTTGEYLPQVKAAAEKLKNKLWIIDGHYGWMGKFQLFERRTGCDLIHNKFHSIGDGAQTATGRVMSKFVQKLYRGFTFGGGKLGLLMFVAPNLVETMINAKKAEPNQKVGTIANGLVESVSWVFTFPIALSIMHHVAGMQYAGMGEDKVKALREKIKGFNELVESDHFKNKGKYNTELKKLEGQIKELEHVDGQNLLTKTCRKIGKFMTLDLERPLSYRNGSFLGNTTRKAGGFFKNVVGVPMRLGIWGWLSMFVLGAGITKGVKSIFGNYYDAMKEEEHNSKKKQQKQFLKDDLRERLYKAQEKKIAETQNPSIKENLNPVVPPKAIGVDESDTKNKKAAEFINATKHKDDPLEMQNNINTALESPNQQELPQDPPNTNPQTLDKIPLEQNAGINKSAKPESTNQTVIQTPREKQYIPSQDLGAEVLAQKEKASAKVDNYTYIPSQENTLKKDKEEQINKYIPSQAGANINKTFDNSGLAAALRRADRAEQKALQTLSGKFGNM